MDMVSKINYFFTIEMELIIFRSAKVRTTVLHFPGLTSPVKEIGFAEVKEKSLTSVGFEPTTSGGQPGDGRGN